MFSRKAQVILSIINYGNDENVLCMKCVARTGLQMLLQMMHVLLQCFHMCYNITFSKVYEIRKGLSGKMVL
jgi:hypothetical protein